MQPRTKQYRLISIAPAFLVVQKHEATAGDAISCARLKRQELVHWSDDCIQRATTPLFHAPSHPAASGPLVPGNRIAAIGLEHARVVPIVLKLGQRTGWDK